MIRRWCLWGPGCQVRRDEEKSFLGIDQAGPGEAQRMCSYRQLHDSSILIFTSKASKAVLEVHGGAHTSRSTRQ
jgi:hypothetical protein